MKPRHKYQNMEIPPQLEEIVRQALQTPPAAPARRHWAKPVCSAAAVLLVGFAVLVNTSTVFAEAVNAIPGIGSIARLITVREVLEEDKRDHVSIRLPALTDTGNAELEERINTQIREKMEHAVAEARQQVQEYREAQLATGGAPEDVIPVMIDIDYELKYSSGSIISFVVNKTQTLANAYTEQLFYNLELPDGRELTLPELLGKDYIKTANAEIERQIAQRIKENGAIFFDADMGGFRSIAERQPFYLNHEGQVVIVFAKYEIAPGVMGIQEFAIPTPPIHLKK